VTNKTYTSAYTDSQLIDEETSPPIPSMKQSFTLNL